MAILLKADGTESPITEPLTLAAMQRLVADSEYIEMVHIGGTRERRELLIVDESGLLKGKPVNDVATALYRGTPARHDGLIVGDAICCVCTNEGFEDEAYE